MGEPVELLVPHRDQRLGHGRQFFNALSFCQFSFRHTSPVGILAGIPVAVNVRKFGCRWQIALPARWVPLRPPSPGKLRARIFRLLRQEFLLTIKTMPVQTLHQLDELVSPVAAANSAFSVLTVTQ